MKCTITTVTVFAIAVMAHADVLTSAVPVSDSGTDNYIRYPNTGRKVATAPDGTIYVVYYSTANGIRVARSTDRGASFASSVQVSTDSVEVEIAVDDDGVVHVAWGNSGSIYYARSTDDGATFSTPTAVGTTNATIHMAVDAPWVYLVPRNGANLYRNGDQGDGTFLATAITGSWVYSDVHVDADTGDVVVAVDNPSVSYFTSSDHGATLAGPTAPGGSVSYSTAVFAATDSNRYIYMGGSGTTGLRIDVDNGTQTSLTLGSTSASQGRTLAVDAYNNVVDGYVDSPSVKFAISEDNGGTFDTAVTVATADYLSVAINRFYGDVVVIYEASGKIYCNVYEGLIQQAPSVTTDDVSSINGNTAVGGGEVIFNGGSTVTERGVCWNTTGTPTTNDDVATAGGGDGTFTASITGLSLATTYYVRAYATNNIGTGYGSAVSFTTLAEHTEDPNTTVDPNDAVDPNDTADPQGTPELQITLTTSTVTATVGEEIAFTVLVGNVGDGTATNAVLSFQVPTGTEFVEARLVTDEDAAQDAALEATVEGDEVLVQLGDVDPDDEFEILLIFEAKTSGTIDLLVAASCDESDSSATAQTDSEVEVEDVYWQIITTHRFSNACGALGVVPVLCVLGMIGFELKRRGLSRH